MIPFVDTCLSSDYATLVSIVSELPLCELTVRKKTGMSLERMYKTH